MGSEWTPVKGDFNVGGWLAQPRLNSVSSAGESRRVEPKVMQVLVSLAEHAGEVVSKEDLIKAAWPETFVSDDVLLRSISELRRVFDDDPKDPRFIQTITKRGYRLIAKVSAVQEERVSGRAAPVRAIPRRPLVLAAGFAMLTLLGAGYLGWRWFRPTPTRSPSRTMLAVLPFQNLSGDPGQEYFSDGLTEEMITQLAGLQPEDLRVLAMTTAMHYKGRAQRIDQIGRELGADYVIEGAVRRENHRVRITAQLVRVADQSQMWAQAYDRDLSSILAVQREVAQAVAMRIPSALVNDRPARIPAARPVSPEAYVAYLMGIQCKNRLSPQELETAVGHFQRAVELDPTFARAWLGLSDAYRFLGSWWGDVPPKKAFPLAQQAVERALELDPNLGIAYSGRGWGRFVYDWNWREAEADMKRGIELSPNSAASHSAYANFLRTMKRLKEAHREFDLCLEIDPLAPLPVAEAALNCLEIGESKKAEDLFLRLGDLARDSRSHFWGLAAFYNNTGRPEKAIEILEEAMRMPRPDRISLLVLGRAYARAGRSAGTRRVIDLLLKRPGGAQASIAELYSRLGDNERAILLYERAFTERDPFLVWLNWTPADSSIWKDRRFQDLVRRMNFP
jgi:TolB-like protein/DNA-binding winged helix-turn-helix (wHTH) protein/Flp pilus assembly protein TadD